MVHDTSHFTFHVGRCREWEMVDAFMPLAKYSSKYIKDPSLLLLVIFVSVCNHSSSSSFPSHLFPGLRREPYFFLSTEDSVYMFRTCMMTAPDENLSIPKRSMAPWRKEKKNRGQGETVQDKRKKEMSSRRVKEIDGVFPGMHLVFYSLMLRC